MAVLAQPLLPAAPSPTEPVLMRPAPQTSPRRLPRPQPAAAPLPIPARQHSPAPRRLPAPQSLLEPQPIAGPQQVPASRPLSDAAPDRAYWWTAPVAKPLLPQGRWVQFDLGTVVADALLQSPRILGVEQEVKIAVEGIVSQDAAFDSRLLLESTYGRTSDPVGNSLVTGGPSRLREKDWSSEVGFQRTTRQGGRWEVTQQLGLLDSNSLFFIPRNQGNTRLGISLSQPLLAGGGRLYNERLIIDARLDAEVARQDSVLEIQNTLAELMLTYWRLYLHRCRYVQQADLLERALKLERIIEGRHLLDTGQAERLRVREQVELRRTELVRARTDFQNEQTRLALLVGSQGLSSERVDELIPRSRPVCKRQVIDVRQAVVQGLQHRPEVAIAAADLENAGLELAVTRNQLLPQLNALVETYVLGLNGNQDVGGSLADQFTEGEPGFSAGLQFEMPVGRRAARAKHRAAHAEYQQQLQAVREAMLTTRSEIEIAVREVNVALELITHRQNTLAAAVAEESYVLRRWELLGGGGNNIGLVVEDLLDAQQSRTTAEEKLVESEVDYLSSLIRLQLAMGTLLLSDQP
ncbi:TolC family protein [Roseimaritima ulvae]|nr:TolC family protein [Roseimaritima ulvae]